jgi:5-methylcytosine-specific restriction protein B
MNTADRSIALVDAALRRRFRFIACPPAFETVIEHYELPEDPLEDGDEFDALLWLSIVALREMNDRIVKSADLGKGKQIGHTRLFGITSIDDLRDVWRFDILPLLEEYYFGQFDRLKSDLLEDTGNSLVNWDANEIQALDPESLYDALCSLADIENAADLASADSSIANGAADTWASGERTVESFFSRIEGELKDTEVARLRELVGFGDEQGYVDTGRGKSHANLFAKANAVDQGVGYLSISDDGAIGFRWEWLVDRDENDITVADIRSFVEDLDDIGPISVTYDGDVPEIEDIYVGAFSDSEFQQLQEVLREFVESREAVTDA